MADEEEEQEASVNPSSGRALSRSYEFSDKDRADAGRRAKEVQAKTFRR